MTDKVVILVTARSLSEARKIARRLVELKLAGCVSLTPIESLYRWQGKVETARERLLLVKSSRDLFDAVRAEISKLHGYSTPEIICLPIVDGSPEYLHWLESSLKSGREG